MKEGFFFATIFLVIFCHGKSESSQTTTVSCLSLILSCLRRRYPIKNSAALHTLKSEFLSGTDSTALGTRSLAMNGTLMNNVGRGRSMSARPRRANPDFSILFALHSKKVLPGGVRRQLPLGRSAVAGGEEGHTHTIQRSDKLTWPLCGQLNQLRCVGGIREKKWLWRGMVHFRWQELSCT